VRSVRSNAEMGVEYGTSEAVVSDMMTGVVERTIPCLLLVLCRTRAVEFLQYFSRRTTQLNLGILASQKLSRR